jgi:archaetidylinositol phosphate synthase
LASDALVTILLFIAIGAGLSGKPGIDTDIALLNVPQGASSTVLLGIVAGTAIALIFFLRMRMEELHGRHATQQASLGGFETEDVLYLFPLATLSDTLAPTLLVAAVCAPLYAIWVVIDYQRAVRRIRRIAAGIVG